MEYTLKDLQQWNNIVENKSKDVGLNFYDQEFEIINYKDMLAYEAYLGIPSRYPHWSFGKAYEKNSTIYKLNLTGLPYEMVINSDPCIAYLMKENTLLLQILTMAHVYGHNDFFKNNRLFVQRTKADYTIEMFKTHGDIIRDYISDPSIGYEKVERILDAAHAIKFQTARIGGDNQVEEDDILLYIIRHGDSEDFEKNIMDIVRKETEYFIPQIETKIMNEGWASYWHYNILNELELPDNLYLEFIKRHNDVISPYLGSINPYFIGFKLFENICKIYGRDKIFEVRSIERDESFIRKYLTEEMCWELGLFEYKNENGAYIISEVSDETGWQEIRKTLCSFCGLNIVPDIKVSEVLKKDKTLLLEHIFDGRELNMSYAEATLKYVCELWGHSVQLKTKLRGKEISLCCQEGKFVIK